MVETVSFLLPSFESFRLHDPDEVFTLMLKSSSSPTTVPLTSPLAADILILLPASTLSRVTEPEVVEEEKSYTTVTSTAFKDPELPSLFRYSALTSSRYLVPEVVAILAPFLTVTDHKLIFPLLHFVSSFS